MGKATLYMSKATSICKKQLTYEESDFYMRKATYVYMKSNLHICKKQLMCVKSNL